MNRRAFLSRIAVAVAALTGQRFLSVLPEALAQTGGGGVLPTRLLGKTGQRVTMLGLGGEGVLRTTGRMREAVQVIHHALDLGITYCDTAPAYQQSQDYYGEALGSRRQQVTLASKTHERTRDGSLRLLEDSLKRLRTDHLDVWQLHDLRTMGELDEIFGKGGAIEAVEAAKQQGLVRFAGITGHHDPRILQAAMRRYDFDTVLCALNAADPHYLPFQTSVVPEAQARGMGVIGMKVLAKGYILRPDGLARVADAIAYVLTLPVSLAVMSFDVPEHATECVAAVKAFEALTTSRMHELEALTQPYAYHASSFKNWAG